MLSRSCFSSRIGLTFLPFRLPNPAIRASPFTTAIRHNSSLSPLSHSSLTSRPLIHSFPSVFPSFFSLGPSVVSRHVSCPPSHLIRRTASLSLLTQRSFASASSSTHGDSFHRHHLSVSSDDPDSTSVTYESSLEFPEMEERPLTDGLTAMEVSNTGASQELTYNRRELARRFGLHPRDLRFLDSSLRNLPSILARRKVIIVNLELFKAIISADSAIVFDSFHPHVQSLVGQIQSYLKSSGELVNEERLPFELIALEFILTSVCRNLEGRFDTYALTLAALLGNGSSSQAALNEGATLMHLLQLKNGLTSFEVVLKETGQAIKDILESDEDMSAMFLTAKKQGINLSVDQHSEVEVILETYLRKVDELENEVKTDVKSISLTEEHIQIRLDTARNAIMKLELLVSIGTLGVAVAALGAGILGMNLKNHFESSQYGVYCAAVGCAILGILAARFAIRLTRRHKIDLFHVDSEEPKLELPMYNKKRSRFNSQSQNGSGTNGGPYLYGHHSSSGLSNGIGSASPHAPTTASKR